MDNNLFAGNIGILYTDNSNSGFSHNFFSPVLDAFKQEVEKQGYVITFINTEIHKNCSVSYLEQVENLKLDGIFLLNFFEDDSNVQELIDSKYPIVTIDYKANGLVSITSDNVSGINDMVKYVHECGHTKIAYLIGDSNNKVSEIRLNSFVEACADLGIVQPDAYYRQCQFRDMKSAGRITEELLALNDPPTCIFYSDDFAAVGGINIIRARGLEVPRDISYCGFDGVNLIGYFEPRITTVKQDVITIGKTAAQKIIELIRNNSKGDGSEIIIPTLLEKGETVKTIYK